MYNIYCITNEVNGKQYIGLTKFDIETRFIQHIKRAASGTTPFILYHAIRKYGTSNFRVNLLEETTDKDREKYYIEKFNTHYLDGVGYNMTYGGDGTSGYSLTVEECEHRRELAKEYHKKKRIGMHGKTHSPETILKMKQSAKLVDRRYLRRGKMSEEAKRRLSLLKKGVKRSPETIQKMRENRKDISGVNNPMYGRKHSQESRNKMRNRIAERKIPASDD